MTITQQIIAALVVIALNVFGVLSAKWSRRAAFKAEAAAAASEEARNKAEEARKQAAAANVKAEESRVQLVETSKAMDGRLTELVRVLGVEQRGIGRSEGVAEQKATQAIVDEARKETPPQTEEKS